jgi:N-acetylgalactosamine kinase
MDGSHWSCSKKYECSSTELDELTDVARSCGALGSRLTGAGWGGCAVSLVDISEKDQFTASVKDKFYAGHPDRAMRLPDAVFTTIPNAGAAIFSIDRTKIW